MSSLKFVLILLEVVLLFNLLIFVHELGHFLAARWRGLKIDRFAIWFGKPIWKKKINGIEYALGTIPAGGYVALPQMATMEAIEGKGESSGKPLPPISPLDKIIVAVAGPLFSFLLAVAFAFLVCAVGHPVEDSPPIVGWAFTDGAARAAGLRPGDRILEIDGRKVKTFYSTSQDSVKWRIITSEGPTINVKALRGSQETNFVVMPTYGTNKWYERKALRAIQVAGAQPAIIGEVATNSPAALAGLRRGDQVLQIDGERIYSPLAVAFAEAGTSNRPAKPLELTIRRGRSEFTQQLVAEKPLSPAKSGPSLGIIGWEADEKIEHTPPFDQVRQGLGQITSTMRAVLSPKGDIGVQQLGGPVMIVRLYSSLFQSENGWRRVLWWSVIINVNLALLNILPLPVLDGGHIVLALVEALRRRPISATVLQYVQTGCAILLIGFMLYLTFFDAGSWIRDARQNREEPIIFAPPK